MGRILMGMPTSAPMAFDLEYVLKGVRGRVNAPDPTDVLGYSQRLRDLFFCSTSLNRRQTVGLVFVHAIFKQSLPGH